MKTPTGFAALKLTNPALLKAIVTAGGKASFASGKGHRFNSERGRKAARKMLEKREEQGIGKVKDAEWKNERERRILEMQRYVATEGKIVITKGDAE